MLEGDWSFCPVTVLTLIKQGSLETIFSPLFLLPARASVNTLSLRLNNLNGQGESTAVNLACDECDVHSASGGDFKIHLKAWIQWVSWEATHSLGFRWYPAWALAQEEGVTRDGFWRIGLFESAKSLNIWSSSKSIQIFAYFKEVSFYKCFFFHCGISSETEILSILAKA